MLLPALLDGLDRDAALEKWGDPDKLKIFQNNLFEIK